jgi:hypothetical protein
MRKIDQLRNNDMMRHLLDALGQGKVSATTADSSSR